MNTEALDTLLDEIEINAVLYSQGLDMPGTITEAEFENRRARAKAKLQQYVDSECLKSYNKGIKSGFYGGQANAGVELEDCHKNWSKWNTGGNKDE